MLKIMSQTRLLIAFMWVIIFSVIFYIGYRSNIALVHAKTRAQNQTLAIVRLLEEQASSTLDQAHFLIKQVANQVEKTTARPNYLDITQILQKTNYPSSLFQHLFFIDSSGKVISSTTSLPLQISSSEYATYFKQLETHAFSLSNVIRLGEKGERGLVLFERVRSRTDQKIIGAIAIHINLEHAFSRLYRALPLGEKSTFGLRDLRNNIIVRHPVIERLINKPVIGTEVSKAILAGSPEGVVITVSVVDHNKRFGSYRRLPNYPFYVFAALDYDSALMGWQQEFINAIFGCLVILIFGALLTQKLLKQAESDILIKNIIQKASLGFLTCDYFQGQFVLTHYNIAAEKILTQHIHFPFLIGRNILPILNALEGETLIQQVEQVAKNGGEYIHQDLVLHTSTANRILKFTVFQVRHYAVAMIIEDVTASHLDKEHLKYQALHDSLTGLPNRRYLTQWTNEAFQSEQEFAMLFIDLDRFKAINDSFGHEFGDQILIQVARRLQDFFHHDAAQVVRLGGDEFIVVFACHTRKEKEFAHIKIHHLFEAISQSYEVYDQTISCSASIGVAFFPEHGRTLDAMIRASDIAMFTVKKQGRHQISYYDPALKKQNEFNHLLEIKLRQAFEKNQLFLEYQPQVSAHDQRIAGVEALLRWKHPEFGLISPMHFIPIAEESGLVIPIGAWILTEACQTAAKWNKHSPHPVRMSVNIAPLQLRHELLNEVQQALTLSQLAPDLLELELTEGGVIQTDPAMIELLKKLRTLGVSLAIDDFGTGYSNLAYLKHFPLDVLKIDRVFIRNLPTDQNDLQFISVIMNLAQIHHLKIVAEGVEIQEQYHLLKSMGCDLIQGYYFHKPMGAEEVERLLTV